MNFVSFTILANYVYENSIQENEESPKWLRDDEHIQHAEVKAFCVIKYLFKVMGEYYATSLLKTISDMNSFEKLLEVYIPTVSSHFKSLQGMKIMNPLQIQILYQQKKNPLQNSLCTIILHFMVYDFIFYCIKFFGNFF